MQIVIKQNSKVGRYKTTTYLNIQLVTSGPNKIDISLLFEYFVLSVGMSLGIFDTQRFDVIELIFISFRF